MVRIAAVILFIALLAVSGAVPTIQVVSPVRQRLVKKLAFRQRELEQQIVQADNDIRGLTRERQIAEVALKTVNGRLSSAVDECENDDFRCGPVADLRVAVSRAQEKVSSISNAISKLKDPERVQRRQDELADVSGQIGFLTKMLVPRPSVDPRPIGR